MNDQSVGVLGGSAIGTIGGSGGGLGVLPGGMGGGGAAVGGSGGDLGGGLAVASGPAAAIGGGPQGVDALMPFIMQLTNPEQVRFRSFGDSRVDQIDRNSADATGERMVPSYWSYYRYIMMYGLRRQR